MTTPSVTTQSTTDPGERLPDAVAVGRAQAGDQPVPAFARATMDEKKRNQLIAKAQKQLHDEGGYIAWGFFNQADAYQNYVGGGFGHRIGMPVCGFHMRHLWIDQEGK